MVSNDWLRKIDDPLFRHCREVVDKTWNYAGRIEDEKDHILNAVLGLGGEAGEIVDLHKKMFYHKVKDRVEDLELELGDLLYYTSKVIDIYDFDLETILQKNKEKLFERHNI